MSFNVYDDPMFGTPIFRLRDAASRTSCPFEGGYRRDNASWKLADNQPSSSDVIYQTADTIIAVVEATDDFARVTLEVCNLNEQESRTYIADLVSVSNTNFVEVFIGNTQIDQGGNYEYEGLDANECIISPLNIVPGQFGGNTVENLRLKLYAPCEESQAQEVVVSVYFGDDLITNTEGLLSASGFTVFPNPIEGNSHELNINTMSNGHLSVFNSKGTEVFETDMNEGDTILDIDNLGAGIYTFHFTTGKETMVEQVVVY